MDVDGQRRCGAELAAGGFGCVGRHHCSHGLEMRAVWAAASCLCDASKENGEVNDALCAEIESSTRALSMAAAAGFGGAGAGEKVRGGRRSSRVCLRARSGFYRERNDERGRECSSVLCHQ
jgi:hypothetical protein